MLKYIVVVLAMFCTFNGFSQELRVGLQGNPVIKEYLKTHSLNHKKGASTAIELPFLDDFSDTDVFPNSKRWIDNNAFINQCYGVYPPTAGVATLDALDATGALHSNSVFNTAIDADYLTSVPINLSITYDNVVLSFYFQPQGYGDAPETQDSLMLDFYSPVDGTWTRVWDTAGTELTSFAYKSILVTSKYKQKGFQFRFHNKVSFSRESAPELSGNCDQWNIDYVYLDKDRTLDTPADGVLPIKDIAFALPLETWLKNYESMPYSHYITNPKKFMGSLRVANVRNGTGEDALVGLKFEIENSQSTNTIEGGSQIIKSSWEYQGAMDNFTFTNTEKKKETFRIKGILTSQEDYNKSNDTIVRKQVLANYYAYDDGYAEYGYGFFGEGTSNAKIAEKFTAEKADTLKGLAMYFNRSAEDTNKDNYFMLKVWTCKNGMPDEELLSEYGGIVTYTDLGTFETFAFENPIVVRDTFFVGIKQIVQGFLNIGLDANHDQSAKTYYNISGTWVNTTVKGALLMRPVFTNLDEIVTSTNPKTVATDFKIYPNPAKDVVNVELPEIAEIEKIQISIYDINGKLMLCKPASNQHQSIDTQNLSSGVYIVKLTDNQSFNLNKKLIILK